MRLLRLRGLVLLATALILAGRATADHPLPPVNLVQFNFDNGSLPTGGSTVGSSDPLMVYLGASSDSGTCADPCDYWLGVEVVPVGQPFQNIPTDYAWIPGKPECEVTPYPLILIKGLLPNTAYKWQAIEYTCSCPPPFQKQLGGVSACLELNGGAGGPTWVPYAGGGTAFTTGAAAAFTPKFVMGYVAATDQGVGQVFFYDKNALPSAQSWKIEVRRTDFTTVVISSSIARNMPGGPPPGDVTGFVKFQLPRVDPLIPTSFEIDLMYRVLVYSGLNGTGTELYRSTFYVAQHPSAQPLAPYVGFAPPVAPGLQPVNFLDLRAVGQNLVLGYNTYQKLVVGPQTLLASSGHKIAGSFQTKFVHGPTIITQNNANIGSGDSILYIRPRRKYWLTTGNVIGSFDVAPKSPNSSLNLP